MKKYSRSYQKIFRAVLASGVAGGAIVATAPPFALANDSGPALFNDLNQSAHYYEPVMSLSARGIVKGYEDGTYKPNNSVTRGQAAKILALALGLDTVNVKNPGFIDVKETDSNYGPIAALVQAGIINGYEDKTFKPNNNLKRSQMAKIITLGFGLEQEALTDNRFTDVKSNDAYAGYVQALLSNNITTGNTSTTFEPNALVTRGQIASFIFRSELAASLNGISSQIVNITNDTIELKDGSYRLQAEMKSLFNPSNLSALKGANITLTAEDGMIGEITSIVIKASGNATNHLILDGKDSKLTGNLNINGDFVSVKNLIVEGNLEIGSEVKNSFQSDSITVKGKTIISDKNSATKNAQADQDKMYRSIAFVKPMIAASAATGPVIIFSNSTMGTVEVSKKDVKIEALGKTNIQSFIISSNAQLKAEAGVTIPQLTISEGVTAITIDAPVTSLTINTKSALKLEGTGKIGEVTIGSNSSKVSFGANTKIGNLILPKGTEAKDVIQDYDKVKANIENIGGETNPGAKPATPAPPVTGGSGGGGGNSGGNTGGGTDGSVQQPEAPKLVTLATGSLGIAGDKKITGLESGKKYAVIVNGELFGVKGNGTLGLKNTAGEELTGTEITGLDNTKTYKVVEATGGIVAQDFGFVGGTMYSAGAGLTEGKTLSDIDTLTVEWFDYAGKSLGKGTLTDKLAKEHPENIQFSMPFDPSFDYGKDGYWVKEGDFTGEPAKVKFTVKYKNGIEASAENTREASGNSKVYVESELSGWDIDRTEPDSWDIKDGWITYSTKAAPANDWYAWQGKKTYTNNAITDSWKVETEVVLTDELLKRNGVRTSMWLNVLNEYGKEIDWSILQFKIDENTKTKGWQYWNSDSGTWVDIATDLPTTAGVYQLAVHYTDGQLVGYIDGKEVFEYAKSASGLTSVKEVIFNSYSFGESYTVKWKVPTVSYVDKFSAGTKFVANATDLVNAIKTASKGDTITLMDNITLTETLNIATAGVGINGNGHKIIADEDTKFGANTNTTVVVTADDVRIANLIIDVKTANTPGWTTSGFFALQVYDATKVILDNVSLLNGDGGLLINAASKNVTVDASNIKTKGNEFGGVEVYAAKDQTATLNLMGENKHDDNEKTPAIWSEGPGTEIVNYEEGYTKLVHNGKWQIYYLTENQLAKYDEVAPGVKFAALRYNQNPQLFVDFSVDKDINLAEHADVIISYQVKNGSGEYVEVSRKDKTWSGYLNHIPNYSNEFQDTKKHGLGKGKDGEPYDPILKSDHVYSTSVNKPSWLKLEDLVDGNVRVVITVLYNNHLSSTKKIIVQSDESVMKEALEAVNSATDVISLRVAIEEFGNVLGVSDECLGKFAELPKDQGRQQAIAGAVISVKGNGFTNTADFLEAFEYFVGKEYAKYEYINAIDGATDVYAIQEALKSHVPVLHANRQLLINQAGEVGEALRATAYTETLKEVDSMIKNGNSLSELASYLFERRQKSLFFGVENIANAMVVFFEKSDETK